MDNVEEVGALIQALRATRLLGVEDVAPEHPDGPRHQAQEAGEEDISDAERSSSQQGR